MPEILTGTNPVSESSPAQERRVFLQPHTGVTLLEDGSILLKMLAAKGADVSVSIGNEMPTQVIVPMKDHDDGLYEATYSDPMLTGPQKLVFKVNGQDTLNPAAPMWYHANSLSNYVELPDPETDALLAARTDVPHGQVRFEFYYSETYKDFMSSLIYVPPGYEEGGNYPVLYLFHEVAENKTAWTDASRMNFLLDNMIAEGLCKPFIVVENDCTVMLDYHDRPDWFGNYPELESFLIHDCIPYMESHYRISSGKWQRAIAGFGLGAAQAGYIGMRNTDVFGSIGLFTAFWVSSKFHSEGKEDPIYSAAEYIGKNPEVLDVFYRSEGDLDMHFGGINEENQLFTDLGVDKLPGYVVKVYHASHNWGSYRRSLIDFAPLLFHK